MDSKSKTCLELEGSLKGENIVLSISENAKLRKTTGIIQAKIISDIIEGKFSQTAANSTGKVFAKKIKWPLLATASSYQYFILGLTTIDICTYRYKFYENI